MGSVKEDIHKKEYEFKNISFSDINVVKGLIIHRKYIDPYKDIQTNNNIYMAGEVNPVNQEIICLFADLDKLIEEAKLTKKQYYIIQELMYGRDFADISDEYSQDVSTIERILETACNRIKELNDYKWKYDNVYLNYLPVKWDYKKCGKCDAFKPKTKEFFRIRSDEKGDGFYNQCRNCESDTKNA